MRRLPIVLVMSMLLLVSFSSRSIGKAQPASPPQSHAFGHTLTEWMTHYIRWFFGDGPDTVKNVRFLPLPSGTLVSGAGTPADPGVFVGHLDVTLKPGQAFFLPINFWYGELYQAGTNFPFNPDPTLPRSVFDATNIRITLDGKTIIDSTKEDKFRYYVPPTYLDPPVFYDEPAGNGAIALVFFQGFGFVHPPLSKGTHTLTLESNFILPGDGFYPNYPDGNGTIFRNSWTITVK